MAGPLWLVKACNKLQGQMTSGASSISQMASIAALREGREDSLAMNKIFAQRCEMVYNRISKMKGFEVRKPMGAFYLFPKITWFFGKSYDGKVILTDEDVCMFFLDKAFVSMVSGSAFGSSDYLRISYATSEADLTKAMDRMESAIELLK